MRGTDVPRSALPTVLVALLALFLALPSPYDRSVALVAVPALLVMVLGGRAAARAAGIPTRPPGPAASPGWASSAAAALAIGLVLGTILLLLLRFGVSRLEPRILDRLARDQAVPLWRWAIILFHAPILEEVMFRLFILSVTAWAVSKLWRGGHDRGASPGALVLANVVAALAFAAVHLPAWFQAGHVSTALVASVIGLNALAGYVMGAVYVRHGLLFAVLAHLGGDVALHLGGRLLV